MPGPFPGMDPYLESPERWPSVHSAMITYLFDALDDVLPPGYAASLEERCRIIQTPFDPPEIYIDIVTVGSKSRVVTTIELLSPVNKQPGEGREQYLAKQQQTLASHTHLIEIDLLRAGPPTVACGRPVYADVPRYDYLVCLHRSGQEGLFET